MKDIATMKLLEKCANGIGCHLCIYNGLEDCKGELLNAVDLCMPTLFNMAKADAVKEFAERVKETVTYHEDECGEFVPWVDCRDIDNLVKEFCK